MSVSERLIEAIMHAYAELPEGEAPTETAFLARELNRAQGIQEGLELLEEARSEAFKAYQERVEELEVRRTRLQESCPHYDKAFRMGDTADESYRQCLHCGETFR